MSRLVSNFSCGAASAVATKLVIRQYPDRELLIINAFLKEEHPDNQRFLKECAEWFGRPITQVRDEKYGASTFERYFAASASSLGWVAAHAARR